MDTRCDSDIPAFRRHVTIHFEDKFTVRTEVIIDDNGRVDSAFHLVGSDIMYILETDLMKILSK
jgi:hypothetical protein